ncbi:MobF family relaxase [Owenweeksia hongkongensis]|uniref:MobF family relaxase n=1 Tax=Owenweeksia hongkongensis TaxID=253245 RepID=UPI003A95DF3B
MIRLVVSMSAQAAKSYFSDALSQSDYYLSDQELPGRWQGKAAQMLGLSGEVQKEEFFALADNCHPDSGRSITPGGNREYRRVGYDINFHCPKSVSLLHGLGYHDDILPAFEQSVQETMMDMEKDIQTRVRIGGRDEDRTTGNLVWASFVHQTARPTKNAPPDPHLHAHCYTFNMSYDQQEKRFKAGQFVRLKKDAMYYQALFHKRLADRLEGLGYTIKKTKDAFEVLEVSEKAIHQFSKRTNHIGQVAKEKGITDADELNALGAKTRSAKQKGLSMPDLRASWESQLNYVPIIHSPKGISKHPYSVKQCKDHALQHCFERNSVATNRAILREAVRHSMGSPKASLEAIHREVENDSQLVKVIHKGEVECTTLEVLREEQEMVSLAIKGQGGAKPIAMAPLSVFENARLSKEQKHSINHMLLNRNTVTLVQGKAGTGKTTMMTEAVRAIEQNGKQVFAFAPTAEASRGVLRSEGFEKADTVASLLADKELHKVISKQVLWIDEAGLMGSRDMLKVLQLADKHQCRVILTGDDRQHRAVVRGDAFRILREVAGLPTTGTKTIYRQKRQEYREAVTDLAEGKTGAGFQKLDKMGVIRELESDGIIDQLTSDYVETLQKGKLGLVISPTHKEREKVNDRIRSELQVLKKVSDEERIFTKLQSLNFTEAQKKDPQNYQKGMVITAHLNINKKLPIGTKATVQEVNSKEVWVKGSSGATLKLPIELGNRFDVLQRKSISLAQGDLIRFNKNGWDHNKSRLDNGRIVKVMGLSDEGHILAHSVSSGHKINRKEYIIDRFHESFDYAYCQTSYASQGKTVDHVFIHQPADTFPATNQEQFYVSVSRGRDGVTIYTDDKEALRSTAEESSRRLSAVELDVHPLLMEEPVKAMPNPKLPERKSEPISSPSNLKTKNYGQGPTI